SLYRAEEGTTMGTISPRVRRSAACTASWIFRMSSSVNKCISPTPGSAAAAEASAPSAEAAAESTASAREPAEASSSPAREICPSATAGLPREWHRHDHHNERDHKGQEQSRREGQHKRHDAPDRAAFPVLADDSGCENADHEGHEEDAPRAANGAPGSAPLALGRCVGAFNRAEHGLDASRDAAGEITVPEPGDHLLSDDLGGFQ